MKERNYGVDALRLVLMFMVCLLHTLGQGGVLANSRGFDHKAYWLIETFAYCAVDGFAFISGYMAADRPQKYDKLITMWFQAFFYSCIVTCGLVLIGYVSWQEVSLSKCLFPVTFSTFWYFTAFFGLYFFMPLLNKACAAMDEDTAGKVFVLLFAAFSGLGILKDPFISNSGYSTLWLIVLYALGLLAKKIRLFEKKPTWALIALWAGCILFSWGLYALAGIARLVRYLSPTILLSGIIMVVLFSRLKLKGTLISRLSPLAFGVYLFQLNPTLWKDAVGGSCVWITRQPLVLGIPAVFLAAGVLFAAGLIMECLRTGLFSLLRIPRLSRSIAAGIGRLMNGVLALLK